MRIVFRWLRQTRPSTRPALAVRKCIAPFPSTALPWNRTVAFSRTHCRQRFRYTTSSRPVRDDEEKRAHLPPEGSNSGHGRTTRLRKGSEGSASKAELSDLHGIPFSERRSPNAWVEVLERYVIVNSNALRLAKDSGAKPASSNAVSSEILTILTDSRKAANSGIDILAHMMTGAKRKAALQICDFLLKDLASGSPERMTDQLPSNILWPKQSLNAMTAKSVTVATVTRKSTEASELWEQPIRDPRYSAQLSGESDRTMNQIWLTLGIVVVQAANMQGEEAQKALNAVQLVLGQVHNLNLVPDNVYAYQVSPFSTAVQRPPIIHLVSSRILAALSDATWRDQQQDNIEKATSYGLSLEQIGRDPPGGRFRLKVRQMDPEVWLEFILWCCVEGGFVNAGLRIVNLLQREIDDPWFAATWTDSNGVGQITAQIDWDRVKTRTGGTVGRLEGYSTFKPLAEMPPRTISTEVVLALIEAYADAIRRAPNGPGLAIETAQKGIFSLISFLEPHDLPLYYFDYIASRLLLTDAFNIDRSRILRKFSDNITSLRTLRRVRPLPRPRASFQLEALLMHSEFTAGLLHQVLESFVAEGNIHDALKTFNDLQKIVDQSKLQAITSFLQDIDPPSNGFFSSRPSAGSPDFVNSHGQLPLYKIAGLLNLSTDSTLVGFGQWLIYNNDPDGPLIPRSTYSNSAIATALTRFAGMSYDQELLRSVSSPHLLRRLPTVNHLRAIFDAQLSLLDLEACFKIMKQLNNAQGGGAGLHNIAHLGGTMLRLESNVNEARSVAIEPKLRKATHLLQMMLVGQFRGRSGVLQQGVRTTFRQQIAHLLNLFAAFPKSSLGKFANSHREGFRTGNVPNLPSSVFSTFLEAVVDSRGAEAGVKLVEQFSMSTYEDSAGSDILDEEHANGSRPNGSFTKSTARENDNFVQTAKMLPASSGEAFIPFDQTNSSNSEHIIEDGPISVAATALNIDGVQESVSDVLEETRSPPADSTPFQSPFFPTRDDSTEARASIQPSESNDSVEDQHTEPVCIYDARIIRLIARKASRELETLSTSSAQSQPNTRTHQEAILKDILKWAKQKFKILGYTPHMISNEIREPLVDALESSQRSRYMHRGRGGPSLSQRKGVTRPESRISRSFRGKHVL